MILSEKKLTYPLVTTVVLSYKKFDKLYDALLSIMKQDYPNIELIVSDDASDNFPVEEITKFINKNKKPNIKNVKIITNDKNVGTVKNINNAFKNGSGKYFIGLPGDDIFFDNFVISKIVKRFLETNYPIISCRRLKSTEEKLLPLRLMPSEEYLKNIEKLDTSSKQYRAFGVGRYFEMASGSATYFSKEHFDEWGYFDEKYKLWEDGPFYAQYTRAGKVIPTAYDIISIRYREGGVSGSSPHPMMIKDYQTFIKEEYYHHKDQFNFFNRRMIVFLYKRSIGKKTLFSSITLQLKYLDCTLTKVFYRIYCNFIENKDKKRSENSGLF